MKESGPNGYPTRWKIMTERNCTLSRETPKTTTQQVEAPLCVNCHITMRHSCTDEPTSGVKVLVYQCVTCGRTQSLERAAD
jgi:hypothetical protein